MGAPVWRAWLGPGGSRGWPRARRRLCVAGISVQTVTLSYRAVCPFVSACFPGLSSLAAEEAWRKEGLWFQGSRSLAPAVPWSGHRDWFTRALDCLALLLHRL